MHWARGRVFSASDSVCAHSPDRPRSKVKDSVTPQRLLCPIARAPAASSSGAYACSNTQWCSSGCAV
eukprot:6477-Heterococcus_DN1.PRE.3